MLSAPKPRETERPWSCSPKSPSRVADAGKTPEVSVDADFQGNGQKKAPAVGDVVIAVLNREGEAYRVPQERPAYMPAVGGQRAAIRVVTGLADPRVMQTVNALKAFRKAVSLAEPRDGPPRR